MKLYKCLIALIVCLLIGDVYSATTIKSYKTTPATDPESVEENGTKSCSGITVDVKLSETPTGTVTANFPNNVNGGAVTATQDKTDPGTYTISGIILKEGGNLNGLELLIDGTALSNDVGVTLPTLKCLESSASASESSASASQSSASASDSSVTPPVIKSISVSTPSMEPTINSGQLFCTKVRVDFELDKLYQVNLLEPKYNSFPATGKNTIYLPDETKPIYYFMLDVSVNGNLDDLYILFDKTEKVALPNKISFKCEKAATDPTSVTTMTTSKSSATSKGGICSEVKVDFTLDNAATAVTDITVASSSVTGTPSITQVGTTSTYSATVTVKEGGDLSDFVVNYKGTPLTSTASITFKCEKESGNDSKSDDGSTSSSLSANSIVVFCFTAFLLLFLN